MQHYIYDPKGAMTVITANYSATTTDSIGLSRQYQGGWLDQSTGLYHFGAAGGRDCDPATATWDEKDGGYWDGMDLYQMDDSNPTGFIDPTGMAVHGRDPFNEDIAADMPRGRPSGGNAGQGYITDQWYNLVPVEFKGRCKTTVIYYIVRNITYESPDGTTHQAQSIVKSSQPLTWNNSSMPNKIGLLLRNYGAIWWMTSIEV